MTEAEFDELFNWWVEVNERDYEDEYLGHSQAWYVAQCGDVFTVSLDMSNCNDWIEGSGKSRAEAVKQARLMFNCRRESFRRLEEEGTTDE